MLNEVVEGGFYEIGSNGTVEVLKIITNKEILVRFTSHPSFEFYTCKSSILRKCIRNRMISKTKFGNFIGVGEYSAKEWLDGKQRDTVCYKKWTDIFRRVYDEKVRSKNPSYSGVSVAEDWHNFQNFARWCNDTPEFRNEDWCLDKDILIKGNKLYSPETCAFVPRQINNLFTLRQNHRGADPIGVSWNKSKEYFTVNICRYGVSTELARVRDASEGFKIYKKAKEDYIKEVADIWKDRISQQVYEALQNYQAEITD